MAEVTIIHNPRCSKSRAALAEAEALGLEVEERRYLDDGQALGEEELLALLVVLEDEPSALVRRDGAFAEAGLAEGDLATAEQVAAVLAAHPALLERPVLLRNGRAIIGRPTERVRPFLEA